MEMLSLRSLFEKMNMLPMVDLRGQYLRMKDEIDAAMGRVLASSQFIAGSEVHEFQTELATYTGADNVVTCASGTDALMLSLMALDLHPGDEVITVPFTFVATAEVIALLGLKPVFVDVRPDTFTMDVDQLESVITKKTKAILPVHLFGQCADMECVLKIAERYKLKVIEDSCQAIGSTITFSDGSVHQAGTMGDMGCISFFPSKNLGCYGDGGAVFVKDSGLAAKIAAIANHGMGQRYYYQYVGINSRLDALQAAILRVKLRHLDEFTLRRRQVAAAYDQLLAGCPGIITPVVASYTNHVYHQYTLKVDPLKRPQLMDALASAGISTAVYYPQPLHLQKAYSWLGYRRGDFPVSELLAECVLSIPMHTELNDEQVNFICKNIVSKL